MKAKKNIKLMSLMMSIVAIILTSIMLIGSTFAWFTDTAVSSGNKIQSGTLKVDLQVLEDDSWTSLKNDTKAVYDDETLWEPGYTDVKVFKVVNEGSLALKWKAKFVAAEELSILANVIDVYVCPSADEIGYPTDRNLEGYTLVGTLAEFVNTIESTTVGTLLAGEEAYLGLALVMREEAGNEYQDLTIGGTFDIQIVATQLSSESDGFGSDYDNGALYYKYVSESASISAGSSEIVELTTMGSSSLSFEIPNEVIDNLPQGVSSVRLAHNDPQIDNVNKSIVFDAVELVDQRGNVINLEDNIVEMQITLAEQSVFVPNEQVAIYHDGELVASGIVNEDTSIIYKVTHLCEISIKDSVSVSSTEELIQALSLGVKAKLTNDVSLPSCRISNNVNIDLNGNTLNFNGCNLTASATIVNGTIATDGLGTSFSKYFDIRPTQDAVYNFTNVDFVNTYLDKRGPDASSNNPTDRVENVIKITPAGTDFTIEFNIDGCNFENTAITTNGLSGNATILNLTIKNTTFTALMSGADKLIYLGGYQTGNVLIEGCTFDVLYTGSKNTSTCELMSVYDASAQHYDVVLKDNKVIANKAEKYTFNPDLGETKANSIVLGTYGAKAVYFYKISDFDYSTMNESNTTLEGEIALASYR